VADGGADWPSPDPGADDIPGPGPVGAPSGRATVRRHADRARYDRETVEAILDEGLICHVGIADDDGTPVVIPMAYGRAGDRLYLHGLPASRLLRALASGRDACVTVTLVDGLVLAKSTFNHSINYRSVVLFGPARLVRDPAAKIEALRVITEHLVPGRSADARGPNERELKQTTVVEIELTECSAKVRSGPPADVPEDADVPAWTGVIPLGLRADAPVPASDLPVPAYAAGYARPGARPDSSR
jgi:nitroimidazol reductase NimA-like FMN-containing flavoprotein (pyridoxamine 5'-phosphate oxidase superfamily)